MSEDSLTRIEATLAAHGEQLSAIRDTLVRLESLLLKGLDSQVETRLRLGPPRERYSHSGTGRPFSRRKAGLNSLDW